MVISKKSKWVSAGGVVLPKDLSLKCYVIRPANNYGPWSFPKGRVDKGETRIQAAVREVYEETGLKAKVMQDSYLGAYEGGYSITHYYLMSEVGGRPTLNDEVDKILLLDFAKAYDLFLKAGNKRDAKVVERVMSEWGYR